MAGFYPYRTQGGQTGGETRDFIIADSATITLGDAVDLTSGYVTPADTGDRLLGVVVGLVQDKGNGQVVSLDLDAAGSNSATHSGNHGVIGSETVVVASDNTTVDKIMARVNIDTHQEYYNDADGNLSGDAEIGCYFDIIDEDQIDESTGVSNGHSTAAQFILVERDPHNDSDASKGIFRICETYWHR